MQETLKKLGYLLISFWQGVNAKQGVLCSCRKKERSCGPSCSCHFCKNNQHAGRDTCTSESDLVVQDLLDEQSDEVFVDDSDDDLDQFRREEMDNDEELGALMDFVFGSASEEE